jgi:hypothetical protein
MFGNTALPARVYAFGAKPPSTNVDLVIEQLHAARR